MTEDTELCTGILDDIGWQNAVSVTFSYHLVNSITTADVFRMGLLPVLNLVVILGFTERVTI